MQQKVSLLVKSFHFCNHRRFHFCIDVSDKIKDSFHFHRFAVFVLITITLSTFNIKKKSRYKVSTLYRLINVIFNCWHCFEYQKQFIAIPNYSLLQLRFYKFTFFEQCKQFIILLGCALIIFDFIL